MKCTSSALFGISFALSVIASAHAADKTMADYKAVFERESAKIEAESKASAETALTSYGKNLAIARDKLKMSGDLDGTIAAKQEIERFTSEKSVLKEPPSGASAWLVRIQAAYHAAVLEAQQVRARKTVSLVEGYTRVLNATKKKLVRQEKLDEAMAVANEIKRVEFIAADAQSVTPGVTSGMTPGANTAAPRRNRYPEDAVEFRNHHYYWLPLRHTSAVAGRICRELGGHLVSIDNRHEYEFVKDLTVKAGRCVWLDLTDARTEGMWKNWRGMRPPFLKWHDGEPNDHEGKEDAACLNWRKMGMDMTDVPADSHLSVLCEWEPGRTPDPAAVAGLGLCEISVPIRRGFSVQKLTPGVNRLSGGFSAAFSHVGIDLRGAQFLRVPWQSSSTHSVTVTKPGYLYVYKISDFPGGDKSRWEGVPDALSGPYHGTGARRARVKNGEKLTIKGYEVGFVATKITPE